MAGFAPPAMPRSGRLEVSPAPVGAGPVARRPAVRPGQFVRLSVPDSVCGIAPGHLAHLFEPFFTTRADRRGTGSTFHLLLPARSRPGRGM
jgi:signal transduction histidine kinase